MVVCKIIKSYKITQKCYCEMRNEGNGCTNQLDVIFSQQIGEITFISTDLKCFTQKLYALF